ncbi:hypothetical protein ACOSQ2_003834 [Xanthoceras sorbifolium]
MDPSVAFESSRLQGEDGKLCEGSASSTKTTTGSCFGKTTYQGLQLKDQNDNWLFVPAVEGALLVQLGDQLEVLSNGNYRSVVHRVTVSKEKKRLSIVSLHSLALNKKIGPASKLVDDLNPVSYKEFSFNEFLDFISSNDITKGRFINTLKRNP